MKLSHMNKTTMRMFVSFFFVFLFCFCNAKAYSKDKISLNTNSVKIGNLQKKQTLCLSGKIKKNSKIIIVVEDKPQTTVIKKNNKILFKKKEFLNIGKRSNFLKIYHNIEDLHSLENKKINFIFERTDIKNDWNDWTNFVQHKTNDLLSYFFIDKTNKKLYSVENFETNKNNFNIKIPIYSNSKTGKYKISIYYLVGKNYFVYKKQHLYFDVTKSSFLEKIKKISTEYIFIYYIICIVIAISVAFIFNIKSKNES